MGVKLVIGVGGGVDYPAGTVIRLNTHKYKLKNHCVYWESENDTGTGSQSIFLLQLISAYKKGIVFKNNNSIPGSLEQAKVIVIYDGNFNYDSFSLTVSESFMGRVEVRNDEDVLIIDNGKSWGNGTYPPDAKNRSGLSGLHAAPIASTNEFADLSKLDPNKEGEITEAERGAGVQYALEKDEDNGL